MIDTVIMTLPSLSFNIIDHTKFNPNSQGFMNMYGYHKFVNNPTKEDYENNVYKPKLTLLKRGLSAELKIEFSAPKVLFKNNLEEIDDFLFEDLVKKLKEKILDMGIDISEIALKNANIIGIHPSKNIILSSGYTSNFVISQFNKVDLNRKLDLTKTSFRNEGKSLQFYSTSHSLVLYDKVSDLNQSKNRAIDKDANKLQMNLFDNLNIRNKEILRIEVRITNKKKLLEILEKIGIKNDLKFKDIINKNLCKKIVGFYVNEYLINKDTLFLFDKNNGIQRILSYILDCDKNLNIKQAIYLLGLSILCRDEQGIRGLREVVDKKRPKTNWLRLKKDLNILQNEVFTVNPHSFVKDILEQIEDFSSIRIKSI